MNAAPELASATGLEASKTIRLDAFAAAITVVTERSVISRAIDYPNYI
jgi:hypothetical protein